MGFWHKILSFYKGKKEEHRDDAQQFKRLLATRYHHFKMLLAADGENHEIITDIEEALRGERVYGIHFVRGICTQGTTAVFQMIRHLDQLAPGRYQKLFEQFDLIRSKIEPHIALRNLERGGALIIPLSDLNQNHVHQCGAKMTSLAEAGAALGTKVPPGFVVTAEGFRLFMAENGLSQSIEHLFQSMDKHDLSAMHEATARVMQLILDAPLPEALETAILDAHDTLEKQAGYAPSLAMRSSALGEDTERTSFAGQHASILNVRRENIIRAYKQVLASKYSPQAKEYRLSRGIRDEDVAMCVGCMCMVKAQSGGVAYSANPMDPEDETISIHSVWGLPKAVVDGTAETDLFHLTRQPLEIVDSGIALKPEQYVCHEQEGVFRIPNHDKSSKPSLTPEQVKSVGQMALAAQEHFGHPQDLEWAFDDTGQLYLLQCRPVQQPQTTLCHEDKANLPPHDISPFACGGVTASGGVAIGPVFIVQKEADALNFPDNAILVLPAALPRRASLLQRAAAVLTERGGAAGHLANVARECCIPALFGIRGIVGQVQNGDIVTVDADMCTIYQGSVEPLLSRKRTRKDLMRGSPVQKALAGAARHIIRLRLLDPDSTDFRPRNCQTLHDIVRFCHETAVREMFNFSMSNSYQKAASRQLICDVPKQFWVLNLEDGFNEAGQQRHDGRIQTSEIESIPMRALWQGMTAVPWEGPPPVNARGFLSVMFEATMNPNLNTTRPSDMSMRNYFIIAKNFCSLQSRFGFHFCGAEAMVSERASENYARFHFKGGATNLERRILRGRFIKEILEEYGFRVSLRQDNLRARLEGFGATTMKRRLRILGYMIIHTRQLDMIMTDIDAVTRRKRKILNDLQALDAASRP